MKTKLIIALVIGLWIGATTAICAQQVWTRWIIQQTVKTTTDEPMVPNRWYGPESVTIQFGLRPDGVVVWREVK